MKDWRYSTRQGFWCFWAVLTVRGKGWKGLVTASSLRLGSLHGWLASPLTHVLVRAGPCWGSELFQTNTLSGNQAYQAKIKITLRWFSMMFYHFQRGPPLRMRIFHCYVGFHCYVVITAPVAPKKLAGSVLQDHLPCCFTKRHRTTLVVNRALRSSCATCPWTLSYLKQLLLSIRHPTLDSNARKIHTNPYKNGDVNMDTRCDTRCHCGTEANLNDYSWGIT